MLFLLQFFVIFSKAIYEFFMTTNFKNHFISKFRLALISKYGKVPACTFIANEFNLNAIDCPPVSSETIRRWLTGVSLPEIHRLATLCQTLNVNPNYFINSDYIKFTPINSFNHPLSSKDNTNQISSN